MSKAISNLPLLLRSLEPKLHDGVYVYCVVPHGSDITTYTPIVTIAELEGLTLVLPEEQAISANLHVMFRSAWITLSVHSDLQAVGLTASVARALSQAGISCNVVAGAFHDHLFVPVEHSRQAMATLRDLQRDCML